MADPSRPVTVLAGFGEVFGDLVAAPTW